MQKEILIPRGTIVMFNGRPIIIERETKALIEMPNVIKDKSGKTIILNDSGDIDGAQG